VTDQPGILDGVEIRPAGRSLRAAILSIGSELLLGEFSDTNATWISQRLGHMGVDVRHHHAAADEQDELVRVLRWLGDDVDVIITGGGLGPTSDDRTREAVAAAAGVALEQREDLEEAIIQRFAKMGNARVSPSNLRQARVPRGARAFDPVGTAPGFAMTVSHPDRDATTEGGATRVYCLPGVPWELQELFVRDVEPEILSLAGRGATLTRVIHAVGLGESRIGELVDPVVADQPDVELSFLARDHEVQVRLTVTADDPEAAREQSQPVVEKVIDALGSAVAGIDEEGLEDAVLRLLGDRGETVATAESATAGQISSRLGAVPGASHGLRGGIAVYATEIKRDVLGVDAAVLEEHGPVAEATTKELAQRAKAMFGADWGIGVTGVAGPSPQNDQPVGTAFWALAHPDGTVEVHGRQLPGSRPQVIARLGSAALDLLRRRLLEA
jgi:nicotinamide-nucleotide amidase